MKDSGALRDSHCKIVVKGSKTMFFDLQADPQENTDIAFQYPERINEMRTIYDTMFNETIADSPYAKVKKSTTPVNQ